MQNLLDSHPHVQVSLNSIFATCRQKVGRYMYIIIIELFRDLCQLDLRVVYNLMYVKILTKSNISLSLATPQLYEFGKNV